MGSKVYVVGSPEWYAYKDGYKNGYRTGNSHVTAKNRETIFSKGYREGYDKAFNEITQEMKDKFHEEAMDELRRYANEFRKQYGLDEVKW